MGLCTYGKTKYCVPTYYIERKNKSAGDFVMRRKLIIDGNAVYELDEDCMLKKRLDKEESEKRRAAEKNAEKGKEK